MGAVTIQQMADRVSALMEERLRVKGRGLGEKVRRGGRLLPRRVRTAAEGLAQSAHMAQNPKLLLQIDEEQVAEAYDICVRHLGSVNRYGVLLGMASSATASLMAVAALVIGVLLWRGFL
ncbi:hypothetical protein RNZ50_04280 [Paracoccaceae bacterium Fryx2]|nr:hypothetical protein [Paracoccaceae bacterium Fryx2]